MSDSAERDPRRLAAQHDQDIEDLRSSQRSIEDDQIRRETREEAHTQDQDRQLVELRQFSNDVAKELRSVHKQLNALEKTVGEWISVSKALAEKGVTTRTFILGVLGVIVAVGALYISAGKVTDSPPSSITTTITTPATRTP